MLHITWHRQFSDAALDTAIARHDKIVGGLSSTYLTLHEAPDGAPSISARQRQRIRQWLDEGDRDGTHRQLRRAAFVTDSAIVRGVLTAVLWFGERHYPMKSFEKRTQALDWLRQA
ncbi:MAG: STAS/SEC14 domain-containing protein [Polyangiaceae bacterium]|nr:STAS/SEC14 domain-containing protein [Polyangiaceae bacterium]